MKAKLLLALLLIAIAFAVYFPLEPTGMLLSESEDFEKALAERVIDGDTIVIEGGDRVRLLGMDTPEKGQHLFEESTNFLKELVEGKEVFLEKDITEKDKYGRLLRYVYLGSTLANLELIKKGYAAVLIYEPDSKHAGLFLEEEKKAMDQGLGIWSFPEDEFCFSIFYFHYNAKGNDNNNLNDEFITFRNKCFEPISLGGWILKDKANNTYIFPEIVVQNKTKITLYTGPGEDNEAELFWGKKKAVWNNNGDTLLLWDSKGNLILSHSYP